MPEPTMSLSACPACGRRILAPRQMQIVELVGEGLQNKEIACRLGISLGTVKVYLSRAYERLRLRGKGNQRVVLAAYVLAERARRSENPSPEPPCNSGGSAVP